MGDLGAYTIDRFIPFQPESYFRLFERLNLALWPAQLALGILGMAGVYLALRRKHRAVAGILAAAFATAGLGFQFEFYAELTPVGTVFGWAFLAQAGLLVAWGIRSRGDPASVNTFASAVAYALIAAGLGLYPLLAPATGRSWPEAEVFGLAPDPTTCVAFGLLLLATPPRWMLALLPIPLVWSAVSSATLHALGAPYPFAPGATALLAVSAALSKALVKPATP